MKNIPNEKRQLCKNCKHYTDTPTMPIVPGMGGCRLFCPEEPEIGVFPDADMTEEGCFDSPQGWQT